MAAAPRRSRGAGAGAGAFSYPAYFEMPPFFTIQPTLNTQKKQLEMWGDLVLSYAKATKKYEWDLTEAANSEVFKNDRIKRRLDADGISAVFADLVRRGNGEWAGKKDHSRITLYWRRPEEWAALIYKWVAGAGKTDTVLTLFELQEGDEVEKEEFYQLETRVMLKALQHLESEGKAQVFSSGDSESLGVKFFGA